MDPVSETTRAASKGPADLVNFAAGWAFFSITTALALAAHLTAAKVATAWGAWAELVGLYQKTVHGLFGWLPEIVAAPLRIPLPDS